MKGSNAVNCRSVPWTLHGSMAAWRAWELEVPVCPTMNRRERAEPEADPPKLCEHFRSPTEFPTTNANQRESLRDATFAGVFREPTLFVSDLFSSSASHLIHHFYCF